jgi:hypothetical protein
MMAPDAQRASTFMSFCIRSAVEHDISGIAAMLRSYPDEAFGHEWKGTSYLLRRDGLGREFNILVAETGDGLAALLASHI